MRLLALLSVLFVLVVSFPLVAENLPGPDNVSHPDIDRLLALIELRLKLAPDVARYKWNTHGQIEDLPRERDIIVSLARRAGEQGLPTVWAEHFFRAQIEASKAAQRAMFARWRREQVGHFDNVPDLARETRPRLDALTPQLLQALARVWPQLCDPEEKNAISARVRLIPQGVEYGEASAMARAPLTEGCAQ